MNETNHYDPYQLVDISRIDNVDKHIVYLKYYVYQ